MEKKWVKYDYFSYFSEEDEHGVFSRLMVKYFLAEGIACEHCLYVASLDCDANQLVNGFNKLSHMWCYL